MGTEYNHNTWGFLEFLKEEEIRKIHTKSLHFLKTKGVKVDHPKALKMLEDAGALIDHNQRIAKFPPDLVEQSLKKVPKKVTLGGRTQAMDCVLRPGGTTYTRTLSGAEGYIDLDTGQFRHVKASDVKGWARLVDALENVNLCTSPYPRDVPLQTRDVQNAQILLENTQKHVVIQTYGKKNLEYIVQMALAMRGSEEELKKRPIVSIICSPISPLQYPEATVDMISTAGKYGIPFDLCVMVNAGATGPVTLAGTLLLTNVEFLAGVVLAQLANPGAPIIYAARAVILDMAKGIPLHGTVENAMYSAASAQLVKKLYGIPVSVRGGSTDAHSLDGQCMIERVFHMLFCALSGASVVANFGSVETSWSVSPAQLIIDDEIYGMIRRIYRGIEVNDDSLGLDPLSRVNPGGEFLTDPHTLNHFKTEIFRPGIFNRIQRELWESEGSRDLVENAKNRAKFLLENHEITPLNPDTIKELRSIVQKAQKQI